jgi:SAM-dependent methyltransferase
MSHQDISQTFDAWAESGRAERMEEGHGDVVRQVIARMPVRAGDKILDLGCGNGWATRILARTAPGVSAVGIDVAPAMVTRAEQQTSYTIRARYEVAAIEALPFADGSFQRIFSMEAIYYSPDLVARSRGVRARAGTGRSDRPRRRLLRGESEHEELERAGRPRDALPPGRGVARAGRARRLPRGRSDARDRLARTRRSRELPA